MKIGAVLLVVFPCAASATGWDVTVGAHGSRAGQSKIHIEQPADMKPDDGTSVRKFPLAGPDDWACRVEVQHLAFVDHSSWNVSVVCSQGKTEVWSSKELMINTPKGGQFMYSLASSP